jgi:hypothetical protein
MPDPYENPSAPARTGRLPVSLTGASAPQRALFRADLDEEPFGDDALGDRSELDAFDDAFGLDDTVGVDDDAGGDELDLGPEAPDAADLDEEDDLARDDLDAPSDEGWLSSGTNATEDDAADWLDIDLGRFVGLEGEDGGEEGVDETASGQAPSSALPALAAESDAEDEEPGTTDDAFVHEWLGALPGSATALPTASFPTLAPSVCRVTRLGPVGPAVAIAGEAGLFALGPDLFAVEGDALRRVARLPFGGEPTSITVHPLDRRRILIGSVDHGLWSSEDAGEAFVAATAWASSDASRRPQHAGTTGAAGRLSDGAPGVGPACFVLASVDADPRESPEPPVSAWARDAAGRVYRSADFGRTWSGPLLEWPAAAWAAPATGGLFAWCEDGAERSRVVSTHDGGGRWTSVEGPAQPAREASLDRRHVAVLGAVVATSVQEEGGGWSWSGDTGRTWRRGDPRTPTGPLALAVEASEPTLYAAHLLGAEERPVILRHRLASGETTLVLDLERELALDPATRALNDERASRVNALAAVVEPTTTTVFVCTGAGLFRITLDTWAAP